MVRVLVLGANGMLGSMVKNVLSQDDELEVFWSTKRISETNLYYFDAEKDEFNNFAHNIQPEFIVNCIGLISHKINSASIHSRISAIELNSILPHKISLYCQENSCKLIQIATDCVFDGIKGNYNENSIPNAEDIYGKTKSLGEVISTNVLHLRSSIIGPELDNKVSLLEWFLKNPTDARIQGYANHYWNGVSTYAFAKIIRGIIMSRYWECGLQHVIPADFTTKADLLRMFGQYYNRTDIIVEDSFRQKGVDFRLSTTNPETNKLLWLNAGYERIPSISQLVEELSKVQLENYKEYL